MKREKKFILAVDLGGTNLKVALCDLRCRIKVKTILDTKSFKNKDRLIAAIAKVINAFLSSRQIPARFVLGLGLGVPGPVDIERGIVYFFPNIPGWKNVALKKILEKQLRIPVWLDNDANLMALGEFTQGAARGARNAVCITLGTGVGGGIILNGSLYRGSSFAAGEIGHLPLNERGPRCTCGGSACLEAYIGNARVLREARKQFKGLLSLETVSALARRGNKRAQAFWKKVGSRLGIGLSGVVNVLNPDRIIIGGGVANAGSVLFDAVRKTVAVRAMSVQAKQVQVRKATLGSDAGLIGAAVLVKKNS